MTLNGVIDNKEKKLKYRYILMVILGIIIILLIIFIGVIAKNNKKISSNNLVTSEINNNTENVMFIALEDNKKEEEQKSQEIENKKQEEEQKNQETINEKQQEEQNNQEAESKNQEENIKNQEIKNEKENQEEQNAKGIIYLTFDDGPTSDTTPKILDILEQKGIKATFFVLHYNENNEPLIKREVNSGHTVALHGYTHTYSEVYQSADTCMENFRKIQEQVYESTGIKSNIIRFPGGSSNTISKKYCEGVMTELTTRAVNEGFKYFDWNVDSDDAGNAKKSEQVYKNVTSQIKKNRSNVVLMHDFAKNEGTVNALANIIDYGLQNGYVFRKITDDTKMVTHKINN